MVFLLYISMPLLCVLFIPPRQCCRSFALRFVFGIALYEFLLLAIGLSLGLTHQLSIPAYQTVNWSVAALLAIQAWRNMRSNGLGLSLTLLVGWIRTRRGVVALLLTVLMAVVFVIQLGFDARYGTRHVDGLWYHIPRVIFWRQQQTFHAWPTIMWEQVGLPVGADVILGQKILLGMGWRGIGLITGFLSLGSTVCIYLAALDLRLSRWQAVMAAILFSSFPAIGLRIWAVNSDIAAAFPVLASFVALHRWRRVEIGLTIFVLLNGVALACKPTVAPLALLVGIFALWRCRHRITGFRTFILPSMASVLTGCIVIASYWPVYEAFSDFQGGDGGRSHKVASITEFADSVVMSAGQWMLEPLAYTPLSIERQVKEVAAETYRVLGAQFENLPEDWVPRPSQDQTRTGLASVLLLPLLLVCLPRRAILPAALFFLVGFVTLSGALRYMPWSGRFSVVLLAGYAVLWSGSKLFSQGRRRWVLSGFVALNVLALLFESSLYFKYSVLQSEPDGAYYYLGKEERSLIASTLKGRPLLVVSGDMDALSVGTEIEFPFKYILFPSAGDWDKDLHELASQSCWLEIVHNGQKTVMLGPSWHRPGFEAFTASKEVPVDVLEGGLVHAGWQLYNRGRLVNLWREGDVASKKP